MQAVAGEHAIPTIAPEVDPALSARAKSISDVDPGTFTKINYKDFLSAAMAGGMTMAEGAAAWKAHRENLAIEGAA
jgi:hypothetical protein